MKRMLLLAVLVACFGATAGELKLRSVYSDHMLFQREKPVVLLGRADAGAEVSATMDGKRAAAKAGDDGRFRVELPAMPAGGPCEVVVSSGTNTVSLKDVLVGELWLCSGQSNMEMPVWSGNKDYRLTNGLDVAAQAADDDLRLLLVPLTEGKAGPREDPCGWKDWKHWERATPDSVKNFSATGYMFGKYLRKRLGVPVGLVNASWGGTRIEPWIAKATYTPNLIEIRDILAAWIDKVGRSGGPQADALRANAMKIDFDDAGWEKNASLESPEAEIRWYRWTVTLPADAQDVRFLADGISDTDETWFDGVKIGAIGIERCAHWSAKRDYPAKPAAGAKHVVAVRMFNHCGPGGVVKPRLVWKGGALDLAKTPFVSRRETAPTKDTGTRPHSIWDCPPAVEYATDPEPALYNGMIAPLAGFRFRGAVWYQGCSNTGSWMKYNELQRLLVSRWRKELNLPDLTFICVQLAGFQKHQPDKPFTDAEIAAFKPTENGYVFIRPEQAKIRDLAGCDSVTAFDVGMASDIHPKNKDEVGRRLAAAAANLCYGAKEPVHGPKPVAFACDGDAVLVTFDGPLAVKGGAIGPHEFTLKAKGGERVWAEAKLTRPDTVRVSAANVKDPIRVDYGWAPYVPKVSLYNAEGFPVMPFRKYVSGPGARAKLAKANVLAHRGMSEEAPENTPAAYEKAVENGLGFECDVYLTKDGRVFSFHDPNLKRIAGIDKACEDCTWDEVKDLDVGTWKGKEWAGQHPSTFEDILALARDGRWIEVDVKAEPEIVPYLKKLLAAQKNATPKNLFFASSRAATIKAIREQIPEYEAWLGVTCRQGWNTSDPERLVEDAIAKLKDAKASGVCLQYAPDIVTEDYIGALHDAGYPVNVWTVDDPLLARQAIARGADTVTSNNPKKIYNGMNNGVLW